MYNHIQRIQVYSILLILAIGTVKAQEELAPINTGAANFLLLTPDARSAAMGGASTALPGSNNAIFHNAATSVLDSQNGGVSYTFAPLMRDFETGHSLNSIAGFYKINKRNVLLAGFRYYHYPQIEGLETDEQTIGSFRPKEWSIDLGYAREIIPDLAVSATVKLIHSDMGTLGGAKSANAVALDLGVIYQNSFDFMNEAHWTAGIQASNLGSKIKYLNTSESLPTFVKAGGSVDLSFTSIHRLVATADVGYRLSPLSVQAMSIGAGAEYILMQHFKARGGYHYGSEDKRDTSYATAGLGVCYSSAQLDFAWLFASKDVPMRNSFWLSLGYSF